MGRFYHNSDGFLMLSVHVQNVRVEPILFSLNPVLTEFVMMLSFFIGTATIKAK